ncbi:glycoside hydrolase 43 family protein [Micromonospora tarensis]|uniref:glycoside hydrolase 43 family protein n=1 Tax=Micromonospora tarensis TaxID=2806100 RepID=UPI00281544B9|nr:glycoside hydrolase 43 family protein [Micromonospora tarensis]
MNSLNTIAQHLANALSRVWYAVRARRLRPLCAFASAAVLVGAGLVATPAAAHAEDGWSPRSSYTSTDTGAGTYSVPLLNADVPDISVERVPAAENDEGRDIYYMISTTMHLSPGAPIMKSYDLVNWEIVNYVFDRASIGDSFSLRNGQNSYGQGQWASSLRYHDGMFYVAFNTNNLNGAYLYRTDDIENGGWQRTALGRGLHDPSLFFDVDGTPYIFYGSGGTSAVRLNADLTAIVQDYPNIFTASDYAGQPFIGGLFEGAQFYHIDGWYYAVIITWPSGQGRQVVMFRSKDLLGRYTSAGGVNTYEARGVLNSNGFAQGSLVPISRADGRTDWHGMFFRDTFPIGRIPALIPATWQDGWRRSAATVPCRSTACSTSRSGSARPRSCSSGRRASSPRTTSPTTRRPRRTRTSSGRSRRRSTQRRSPPTGRGWTWRGSGTTPRTTGTGR